MGMQEIWTVGHSNRSGEAFLTLLASQRIELLVDVRRFPGSRRHPQFGSEALAAELAEQQIAYRHSAALGGRRGRSADDSPNTAWRVESFNAYADYMATPDFQQALEQLKRWAAERRTAIMCSEALPWRCHRRLIADALIVAGWQVWDIFSPTQTRPHGLTEFARVQEGRLTYPAQPLLD